MLNINYDRYKMKILNNFNSIILFYVHIEIELCESFDNHPILKNNDQQI